MKKTLERLSLELCAAFRTLDSADKADKPRLHIRYLAAKSNYFWELALMMEDIDPDLSGSYRGDAKALARCIEEAKLMRRYMEEAHANSQ